jgi:hypothetical protein
MATMTLYDKSTGALLGVVSSSSADILLDRESEAVGLIDGRHDEATHKVDLATLNVVEKE